MDASQIDAGIEKAQERAARRIQTLLYREAIRRSSGTATEADRRQADYPYARRHGSPLWDPSEINVGKGDFKEAWRSPSVMRQGDEIVVQVVNASPVADFLKEGTPTMFARPLAAAVEAECAEAATAIYIEEIERAFQ